MTAEDLVAAARGQMEIVGQRGDLQVPIVMVTDDSRAVVSGSLFVAVKGSGSTATSSSRRPCMAAPWR